MPRQKYEAPEDVMVTCPRCGGEGVLRSGTDEVRCPLCRGQQRVPERVADRHQVSTARRQSAFNGDITFLPLGRESGRISVDRLLVSPAQMNTAPDTDPGGSDRIVVAAIDDGTANRQRFRLVEGSRQLLDALRRGDSDVSVEVLAEPSGPVRGLTDVEAWQTE